MILLTIIDKGKIMYARVSIKNCVQIGCDGRKLNESEIKANGRNFNQYIEKNKAYLVDCIRASNIHSFDKETLISTRNDADSLEHDIYSIPSIPPKANSGLDNLYGYVMEDIRRSIPNQPKGRVVSLNELDIKLDLDDKEMLRLASVSREIEDEKEKLEYYKSNNLLPVVNFLNFLDCFDFTVDENENLSLEKTEEFLSQLEKTKTDAYVKIQKLVNTAKKNTEIYSEIERAYYSLNGRSIIQKKNNSKEKTKIKVA